MNSSRISSLLVKLAVWMGATPGNVIYMLTWVWSAKEALLSLLHKGLRLDTRSVEILSIEGMDKHEVEPRWERVEVQCHIDLEGKWSVWWHANQGYVFTMAVWLKDGGERDIILYDVTTIPGQIQKLII